MLDVGLPFGFAVEVDAFYRREGYRTAFDNFAGGIFSRERANSWEVPVLLKYRLPLPILKPYVESGVAPRTINGSISSIGSSIDLLTGKKTYSTRQSSTGFPRSLGTVAGGGIQLGIGPLRVSPEVRYTYWNSTPIQYNGSQGYRYESSQHQVDVLVGLSWKAF